MAVRPFPPKYGMELQSVPYCHFPSVSND